MIRSEQDRVRGAFTCTAPQDLLTRSVTLPTCIIVLPTGKALQKYSIVNLHSLLPRDRFCTAFFMLRWVISIIKSIASKIKNSRSIVAYGPETSFGEHFDSSPTKGGIISIKRLCNQFARPEERCPPFPSKCLGNKGVLSRKDSGYCFELYLRAVSVVNSTSTCKG